MRNGNHGRQGRTSDREDVPDVGPRVAQRQPPRHRLGLALQLDQLAEQEAAQAPDVAEVQHQPAPARLVQQGRQPGADGLGLVPAQDHLPGEPHHGRRAGRLDHHAAGGGVFRRHGLIPPVPTRCATPAGTPQVGPEHRN